ncbi:hypothetical protein GF354_05095 [Candidatus Peregrinibacteria bacterium]|nr:hypothetical protein [Candidatus Peregrinibacteria bacterium]
MEKSSNTPELKSEELTTKQLKRPSQGPATLRELIRIYAQKVFTENEEE